MTRPLPTRSMWPLTALAAALIAPAAALAHDDDAKLLSSLPAYEGPAFRKADLPIADRRPSRKGAPRSTEGTTFQSLGVELMSWLPLAEFGSHVDANDCWGYVSPSGREYALIGLRNGTGIAEITDPANAQVVTTMPGPSSLWRDIKTYGSFAYAVTEGTGKGIQVFDLSDIDNGNVLEVAPINTGGLTDTHNVAIDEVSGFLYRTGGQSNVGLRIYSLASPGKPSFVGEWSGRYVHDAQIVTYSSGPYAGQQIAFCASGFNNGSVETGLDILDVTDKQNIQLLDRLILPNGAYSHQVWLSEDRQYLYLNDELDENGTFPTTTIVIDVSDLSDPQLVSTFTNGNTAIGHNLYVRGDLIFEANYRSGLRVFDASNPIAPTEIASFDTFPDNDNASFNGLWSSYPFFPSRTVIGSDRERGLFVWQVEALLCRPDLDATSFVGLADLTLLLNDWGACTPDCASDLDDDGVVGLADLTILLNGWGDCPL